MDLCFYYSKKSALTLLRKSDVLPPSIAALNGTELGGRTLTINEAKPKTDRPKTGQRFGGGGGGGRNRDDYRGHARQPREPRW